MWRLSVTAWFLLVLYGCDDTDANKKTACNEVTDPIGLEVVVYRTGEDGATEVYMRTDRAGGAKRNAVGTFWKVCPQEDAQKPGVVACPEHMQQDGRLCAASGGISGQLKFAWKRAGLAVDLFDKLPFVHPDGKPSPSTEDILREATEFAYETKHPAANADKDRKFKLMVFKAKLEMEKGSAKVEEAAKDKRSTYQWVKCNEISTRNLPDVDVSLNHDEMIMAKGVCPKGSVDVSSLIDVDTLPVNKSLDGGKEAEKSVLHAARGEPVHPPRRGFREAEVAVEGEVLVAPSLLEIRKA